MQITHAGNDCRQLEIHIAVRQLAYPRGQLIQIVVELLLRMEIEGVQVFFFVLLPQEFDILKPALFPLG